MSTRTISIAISLLTILVFLPRSGSAQDTDGDGMPDLWENTHPCVNPLVGDSSSDPDGETLRNILEYAAGSNPCNRDTDVDGMSDSWEYAFECTSVTVGDAGADYDGDLITNLLEYQGLSNPCACGGKHTKLLSDFRVDQDTGTQTAYGPEVATNSQNNTLVAWSDNRPAGATFYSVYYRIYGPDGSALTEDFPVERNLTQDARVGDVAAFPNGNFVIVWYDKRGTTYDAYARIISGSGAFLTGEIRVDQAPAGYDVSSPKVITDSNNNFIVAWQDTRPFNFYYDLYARRFDSSGAALGNEFIVDQAPEVTLALGGIARDGNNNIVFTWYDRRNGNQDIFARFYDASGAPLGNDFRVDQDTGTASVGLPAIAVDQANIFTIVWSDGRAGNNDIYARRYDATGAPLGKDFRVDQATGTSAASNTTLAAMPGGKTIIVWSDYRNGNYDIYARIFAPGWIPLTDDFRIDGAAGTAVADSPVATGGPNDRIFFFWNDYRSGNGDIYANLWFATENDTDCDGLIDSWENNYSCMQGSTVDNLIDTDSDGLTNQEEFSHSTNPCDEDSDNDQLLDGEEINIELTNPLDPDSDDDAIPDGWEVAHFLNPLLADSVQDPDGDGLINLEEFTLDMDPLNPDSDGDFIPDGAELHFYDTDPWLTDSDGDGVSDVAELFIYRTDPSSPNAFSGAGARLINYQGRLTDDDGVVVGGTVDMSFALFDGETGGTPLWKEYHQVRVVNGIYNTFLGGDTVVPASALSLPELYLEVAVGGQTLAPRQKITAVLHAASADLLQGQQFQTGNRVVAVSPAAAQATVHVSFETDFVAAPRVVVSNLSQDIGGQTFIPTRIFNITPSGFDVTFKSLSGNPATGSAAFGFNAFGQ